MAVFPCPETSLPNDQNPSDPMKWSDKSVAWLRTIRENIGFTPELLQLLQLLKPPAATLLFVASCDEYTLWLMGSGPEQTNNH
jgi:hypothetical protein